MVGGSGFYRTRCCAPASSDRAGLYGQFMSLTSHLKDPESPVRQFILASAPELSLAGTRGADGRQSALRFGFDALTELETKIPIPASVKPVQRLGHAVTAGTALDYRIRMDLPGFNFAETVGKKGLDILAANSSVVHRGKHIHRLLDEAYRLTSFEASKADPDPASVAFASIVLAWCESIYRAGPRTALTSDLGLQIKRAKDSVDLIASIDHVLLFDVDTMHRAIVPLIDEWNQAAASGLPYVANPHFIGSIGVGGADGDLAISDLLVDVKTRQDITNPWLRESLLQLVGYALLDLDDSYGIRRLGILLPRQPYFSIWSLDDLLGANAEQALPELRERFGRMITSRLIRQLQDDGVGDRN